MNPTIAVLERARELAELVGYQSDHKGQKAGQLIPLLDAELARLAAPVDERAAFEAWIKKQWSLDQDLKRYSDGDYVDGPVNVRWKAWQARAALTPNAEAVDEDALVERVARAIHTKFVSQQIHPEDWPTWGALLAEGHQGANRVEDTRVLARAALSVLPRALPMAVTDEMMDNREDRIEWPTPKTRTVAICIPVDDDGNPIITDEMMEAFSQHLFEAKGKNGPGTLLSDHIRAALKAAFAAGRTG